MGNTFTTPQPGIPVIMDGAESTPPTSTSTDVDFRSAESYASTSKEFPHDKESSKLQQPRPAAQMRDSQHNSAEHSTLGADNHDDNTRLPNALLSRETSGAAGTPLDARNTTEPAESQSKTGPSSLGPARTGQH